MGEVSTAVYDAIRDLLGWPNSAWVSDCPNIEWGRTIEVHAGSKVELVRHGEVQLERFVRQLSKDCGVNYTLKILR